jgi:predicted MFS family arabinose efflux permease
VVAAVAFLARERRAPEPLVPLRVLRERAVGLSIAANAVAGSGFTAGIVYLPVAFQAVAGEAATTSGLLLVPLGVSTALTTVAVGQLVHRFGGAKLFPALGMVALAGAYAWLSTIGPGTGAATAAAAGFLAGVGVGCVMQTLLHVVQRSVPPAHLGTATSSVMLGRITGAALGVALFGAIFNHRLADEIGRVPGIDVATLQGDPESIARLEPGVRDAVRSAFASSLGSAFRGLVPLMLVGLLTVLAQRAAVLRERLRPVVLAPPT